MSISSSVSIEKLLDLVRDAGAQIMAIYQRPFDVQHKADLSPLTAADLAAHHCLVDGLRRLTPNLPILSEETPAAEYQQRQSWTTYWLIDPLDGTKEFIQRNGEFTVNLALVHQQRAVLGVVYAPALDQLYWGWLAEASDLPVLDLPASAQRTQAFQQREGQEPEPIKVRALPAQQTDWIVLTSRSHPSQALQQWQTEHSAAQYQALGSSLKLCRIAAAEADLYPRLGPTSEWDTAAAQAVLEAAGGKVVRWEDRQPLRYNQRADSLENPWFLAGGGAEFIEGECGGA